jgi:hypothetical protein
MVTSIILGLTILETFAHGLVHRWPRQTPVTEQVGLAYGWAPQPTAVAKLPDKQSRRDDTVLSTRNSGRTTLAGS